MLQWGACACECVCEVLEGRGGERKRTNEWSTIDVDVPWPNAVAQTRAYLVASPALSLSSYSFEAVEGCTSVGTTGALVRLVRMGIGVDGTVEEMGWSERLVEHCLNRWIGVIELYTYRIG